MEKFILKIERDVISRQEEEVNEHFQQLMSLERHFTAVDVTCQQNFTKNQMVEVFERFGKRVTDLKLDCHQILSSQEVTQLLENMTALEKLTLHFTKFVGDSRQFEDIPMPPVTFKKLKKLEVQGEWKLFRLVEAPALTDLHTPWGTVTGSDLKSFESFLKASPKLESLKTNIALFGDMEAGFPFRLKKIFMWPGLKFDESVKKFLLFHAETVELLVTYCDDLEFFEMVLTKFIKLKYLTCQLNKFAASHTFNRNPKPLPMLSSIKSVGGFLSETNMQNVLGNYPQLTHLDCLNDRDQIVVNHLDFVAESNRNLEFLGISRLISTKARFPRLKTLHLYYLTNSAPLVPFLKANPTIENLRIQWLARDYSSDSLGVLINETSLKHVHLTGESATLNVVFNKIKSGYGTWKTLKLHPLGIFIFEFPENPANWKPLDKLSDYEDYY